ncbi:basic proline-rich protein-like [Neovison vison]|uniref:basic proline-rich protein-like n=1 Tax=Neovison vison TaxID=452646 RepID=UPI001CEFD57F|nr:basic proline-rich protein-like [Neogale vison]
MVPTLGQGSVNGGVEKQEEEEVPLPGPGSQPLAPCQARRRVRAARWGERRRRRGRGRAPRALAGPRPPEGEPRPAGTREDAPAFPRVPLQALGRPRARAPAPQGGAWRAQPQFPRLSLRPPPRTPAPARTRTRTRRRTPDPGPCSDPDPDPEADPRPRALLGRGPGGGPQIPAPGWDPDADADPRPRALLGPGPGGGPQIPAPGWGPDADPDPRPRALAWPGTRTQTRTRTETSTRTAARLRTWARDPGLDPDLCPSQTRPRTPTPTPGLGSDPGPRPAPYGPDARLGETQPQARTSGWALRGMRTAGPRPQAPAPLPHSPARAPPGPCPRSCAASPGAAWWRRSRAFPPPPELLQAQPCPCPARTLAPLGLHETSPGWRMSLVRGQTNADVWTWAPGQPSRSRAPRPPPHLAPRPSLRRTGAVSKAAAGSPGTHPALGEGRRRRRPRALARDFVQSSGAHAGPCSAEPATLAAVRGAPGSARRPETVGPPRVPERGQSLRARPSCPQSWQPAPRNAAAERAPAAASVPGRPGEQGPGLAPARPRSRAAPGRDAGGRWGSSRRGAPWPRRQAGGAAGRGRAAGSAGGGVPAGARTRACGARRGVRAANPLLEPPAPPARAGPRRRHAPGARRVCAKPPPPHSAPGPRQTSGRAAAGPALSPRPPGGAHCARAAPRGRPEPARSPQRARRPGFASCGPRLPPAREARELGESRGARRPGPPRQGVGVPGPARFRFRRGQRSPEALVADAETGCCPPLLGEVRRLRTGKPGSEEEERRGAGHGRWGLAVRLARPSLRPGAVPPCEELREMAPRCALRFTRARREAFRTRTQTRGPGPVRCRHESAAPAASPRAPPPRAGQSTCVSRVTIGFRGDS